MDANLHSSGSKHRHPEDSYQSPFRSRYCRNSVLLQLFSETNKIVTWRQLWVWLAEAQHSLGLPQIKQEMIQEMRGNVSNIDWEYARAEEKRLRHDVMSHIHAFEKVCPKSAGIIHLGATSAYVQDNADLIVIRDALDRSTLPRIATCLQRFQVLAEKYKDTPTVGRTHYQAASLTTIGKRASLWCQDLLVAFRNLTHFRQEMKFRGVQGATGSQASFLTLFQGNNEMVMQLHAKVTEKAAFEKSFTITGQTYTRLQDAELLNQLALVGAAVHKICMDIRVLQAFGEIQEPFEDSQVGSSAMPYKRNPMRSERCCGFARFLMNLPGNALNTAAEQGFERTLDDSANRRLVLPDAFLSTEAMLMTLQNILEGLVICGETVRANVMSELPFLALEHILMELTLTGASRQEGHEKIRQVSLAAHDKRQKGENVNLASILEGEAFFDPIRDKISEIEADPRKLIGRCPEQVEQFIEEELKPVLKPFGELVVQKCHLAV